MTEPIPSSFPSPIFQSKVLRLAWRGVLILGALLILALGFLMVGMRYWLLPRIDHYREPIAQAISRAVARPVAIGSITAGWEGLYPQLSLTGIDVRDAAGGPALTLSRVESALSWLTLISGEIRFHSLEIAGPELTVRRDPQGTIWVAGVALTGDTRLSDWLLRQGSIVIRGAALTWRDEQTPAPPLTLWGVDFRLDSSGRRHRFGLRAIPPREVGAPIDLRGDFTGASLADPAAWQGRLFGQVDDADLSAWRRWLPHPAAVGQGRGALRVWVDVAGGQVTGATGDLRLADVKLRLAPELPELDLTRLAGRLGWAREGAGFRIVMQRLGMVTRPGAVVEPTNLRLKFLPAQGRQPEQGELQAKNVDLRQWAGLADHFPLQPGFREILRNAAPRGDLLEIMATWKGLWSRPDDYAVQARFAGAGINPLGEWPGFSGFSGSVEASESVGKFSLTARDGKFNLPRGLGQEVALDTFTAQAGWRRTRDGIELSIAQATYANRDLAGTARGSYRMTPEGPGWADLSGTVSRADGRAVGRYLPLAVNEDTRHWLRSAIGAGQVSDLAWRLHGNLKEFPFARPGSGTFQVTCKVTGVELDYMPGWPKIRGIDGRMAFRGKSMEIQAERGAILGAKLSRVKAAIPDLETHDERLEISGEAEGPTAEFLQFVEQSPVGGMIDDFTAGMQAQGAGKLALKLEIPLRRSAQSKVAGSYQFARNRFILPEGLPPLDQASGRVDFTESGVRVQNATAQFLGTPATLNAVTQPGGTVVVSAQGRATAEALRQSWGHPLLQKISGAADWRGTLTIRNRQADLSLESSLQGLALAWPAPFGKRAGDVMPLQLTRTQTEAERDRLTLVYGRVLTARLVREREGKKMTVRRGRVHLGVESAQPPPERSGIWITGALPLIDLDSWRPFLASGGAAAGLPWGGVDLSVAGVEVSGRRFGELRLTGRPVSGGLQWSIAGGEVTGDGRWSTAGKGKIAARLKSLRIPAAASPIAARAANEGEEELPALDVVVDSFHYEGKNLGKLELAAATEGRDWIIEKLRLTVPEGSLYADGLWQSWVRQPRTQVNLNLKVADLEKFLGRFGYSGSVRRGSAQMEGPLSWAGSPASLDFSTLSGNLALKAEKGQFAKLEPGLGKLFGILSLQALPRRITLDFRDIFSEGFAFDEIAGNVKITQGVAHTDDFRIQGPAARVLMSGDVDLTAETQKLRVKVTPTLGEGVSLAGALLASPVVGLTAFLVQKALQDPLDQLAAFEYNVTGTWSEPTVSKIQSPGSGQPPS